VSDVFQHYNLATRLRLLGPDGSSWEDFDFYPDYLTPWSAPKEDHWKMFSTQIAPGSLLGAQQNQKRVYAFALRKDRDISRKSLLRAVDWPEDPNMIEKELVEEEKLGLLNAGGGRTPRQTTSQKKGSPV
jgi:hypothetical protein